MTTACDLQIAEIRLTKELNCLRIEFDSKLELMRIGLDARRRIAWCRLLIALAAVDLLSALILLIFI